MLPDPVPPYTRFTDELENRLTLSPSARGSALFSFIRSAAPSASTCWTSCNPQSTISSVDSKSEVKYCALSSSFCNFQNVPPTKIASELSKTFNKLYSGTKITARIAHTIDNPFHGRIALCFALRKAFLRAFTSFLFSPIIFLHFFFQIPSF